MRSSSSNTALLGTEELSLAFTPDAVDRIADFAARVNDTTENIGARRLHTVMERLLDELSFSAPELSDKSITIDAAYVDRMLADIVKNEDLSRYISKNGHSQHPNFATKVTKLRSRKLTPKAHLQLVHGTWKLEIGSWELTRIFS